MKYDKSLLIYQDRPVYGIFLKGLLVLMPAALLITSAVLLGTGDSEGSLVLLAEACLVGLIFWGVFPRSYQVYEDHIRVVLGGPFSVKTGFDNVKSVGVSTSTLSSGMNFVTRFTRSYVSIVRKNGMPIAITPKDNEAFVENVQQAMKDWARTSAEMGR